MRRTKTSQMSWSRCGTIFAHHVRSSAYLAMSCNREPYHKWLVDMHPHLHSVKPPIEIHTFFSFRCLLGKQLENGTSLDLDSPSFALGSGRPAPARLLATDNGQCVLVTTRSFVFSCLEPGICLRHREGCAPQHFRCATCTCHISPPVLTSPTCASCLRFLAVEGRSCKASWMRSTQSACSNAGLTIFRATYLDNTSTDLRAMGSAKP